MSDWIRSEQQQPEQWIDVLGWFEGADMCEFDVVNFDGESEWYCTRLGTAVDCWPQFWMPLPKAPTQ